MKYIAKKFAAIALAALMALCAVTGVSAEVIEAGTVTAKQAEGLRNDFITGADVSSLLSLEASGRKFYGFDGREQDLLKTLNESGVNYIRVRVWNDPFDENGNGYGGGNCTVDTAIELGRRAARYGMGLLVDFHYSDFWADPGKQQAPKAWRSMSFDEKAAAVRDFTIDSITRIEQSGVRINMVQVGNETNNGFCGETDKVNRYSLMKTAAQAVRDTDPDILIATHFTNPEKRIHTDLASDLQTYGVDYDVFSTSFYPEYHGTVYNLKEQLAAVHALTGKRVMIAETSWSYDSTLVGAYKRSVQGQADEIADCIQAMADLGDYALGMFYWEPAWIDVPGDTEAEKSEKRELYGAGWASSYAGAYDPDDAGQWWGATACVPSSLFDPEGHPSESLKAFKFARTGTEYVPQNYLANPSFESGTAGWDITETTAGTVGISTTDTDARDGSRSLHFWSGGAVGFTAQQTVNDLPAGDYSFSLSAQGDNVGAGASLKIFVESGNARYEQEFTLDGWRCWKVPMTAHIPLSGSATVGVTVNAAAGAWGSIDCMELIREPETYRIGDANRDGKLDIRDVTATQRALAGFASDSFDAQAADITGDGLTVDDATETQRFLAEFDNVQHVGERVRC